MGILSMYLFDMDGTLTEPRQRIDPEFAQFLIGFAKDKPCYVVTGSDYAKVHEQLGADLCHAFAAIYACNGNVRYEQSRITWWSAAHNWQLNKAQTTVLLRLLGRSKFWLRTGNHIEQRIGCANFSIVGRNATPTERGYYTFWDRAKGERETLVKELRRKKAMRGLEFVLGGETGIDIYPEGFDKAQVRTQLAGRIQFIGDKCEPGGNDYSIAMACDQYRHVKNWRETFVLLS
jgi:phosphomannomutase